MKTYIPFLLLIVIYSCVNEVDLNIDSNNLLVVNSIIFPDSTIKVQVGRSQDLCDSSETIPLNTAEVSIYKDSTFVENLNITGDGIYESDITPIAGSDYTIKVNSGNLAAAYSTTSIPVKTKIDTVITFRVEDSDYGHLGMQISFTDDGATNDYYLLKMWGSLFFDVDSSWDEETETYLDSTLIFSQKPFYINDPLISPTDNTSSGEIINSILGEYSSGRISSVKWIAFPDININGISHSLELFLNQRAITSKEYPLYIYLEKINQDYYYYLQSIANTSDNSVIGNITSTTTSVYSNIENGTGIFSSANVSVYPLTENHWSEDE